MRERKYVHISRFFQWKLVKYIKLHILNWWHHGFMKIRVFRPLIRGGADEEIFESYYWTRLNQAEMCKKWDPKRFQAKKINFNPSSRAFLMKKRVKFGQLWDIFDTLEEGSNLNQFLLSLAFYFPFNPYFDIKVVQHHQSQPLGLKLLRQKMQFSAFKKGEGERLC